MKQVQTRKGSKYHIISISEQYFLGLKTKCSLFFVLFFEKETVNPNDDYNLRLLYAFWGSLKLGAKSYWCNIHSHLNYMY